MHACWLTPVLFAFAGLAHAGEADDATRPPASVAAPQVRLLGEHTPAAAAATRQLFDDALGRLPAVWSAGLGSALTIEWRNDLPAGVHGRALGSRLLLRRALLDDVLRDGLLSDGVLSDGVQSYGVLSDSVPPDASSRRTANADAMHPRRAALAAVIHELAHVYDRGQRNVLSRDPRLLDLAGWQVAPLRLGRRASRNDFRDRSPDPYELHSPAEFVAVNLEHFLLDPDYACRRPALHRHFVAHFGMAPASTPCAPDLPYVQATGRDDADALLLLDPARVYAIDYLLAEGNERPMSRWGHSMLRLVVCAPGRAPGPDCRLDLQHHRVLSFRAFVDDVQISSWRGLTGAYPSRLFVLPLAQVIDEYTKVELRGLQSIPLRLAPGEIAGLLERAADLHWRYDGRYYFVSNNCAVETFKLLHDGVPRLVGAALSSAGLSSITPTGLLQKLQRAGIADTAVLADAETARRLGHYFEPMSARYAAMYDAARAALPLPAADVQGWFALEPEQRAPWLQRGDLRASAALLLLEEAALRREELLARDELKRRVFAREGSHDSGPLDALRDVLQLEGLLSRPSSLLPAGGYGLPQREEREAAATAGAAHRTEARERGIQLRAAARAWLPPRRIAAIESTESNVDALGARLRQLHREQGGLQLR